MARAAAVPKRGMIAMRAASRMACSTAGVRLSFMAGESR